LFEECGFDDFRVVRRQGALGPELHLSARSRGAGEARTAIVLRRDGKEIGRERVTEVRGALHHYGPAHAAWLITTGQVLSGAREEASAPGAAPVQLTDGAALARLCEERHVGLVTQRIDLPLFDADLFETLAP
jgi:restriction endonuclease Mrr